MGKNGETAILRILRSKSEETAGNHSNFSEACNLWTAGTGPWGWALRNEEKFVERYREVRQTMGDQGGAPMYSCGCLCGL